MKSLKSGYVKRPRSRSLNSAVKGPRLQKSAKSLKFLRVGRLGGSKTLASVTWIKVATEADSEAEVMTIIRVASMTTHLTVTISMVVRLMTTTVVVTSTMGVVMVVTLLPSATTTRVECQGSTMGLARSVQISLPQVMVGREMPVAMSADSSRDGMRPNDQSPLSVYCVTQTNFD